MMEVFPLVKYSIVLSLLKMIGEKNTVHLIMVPSIVHVHSKKNQSVMELGPVLLLKSLPKNSCTGKIPMVMDKSIMVMI